MSPCEFLTKHQSVLQVYCQDQMIWYETIQCFRIATTRKALPRCVRQNQPALLFLLARWLIPFQELTDITLVCKDFPISFLTNVQRCQLCKTFVFFVNLCQLEEEMQIKGENHAESVDRHYSFCPLLQGGLTGTWEEKIFRIRGHGRWSNLLLPKGEFSPKTPTYPPRNQTPGIGTKIDF